MMMIDDEPVEPVAESVSESIGELTLLQMGEKLRALLTWLRWGIPVLTVVGAVYLMMVKDDYVVPFLLIGSGATLLLVMAWRSTGMGIPLLPVVGLQHFLIYGLPLVTLNETALEYPVEQLMICGSTVFLFMLATGIGGRMGWSLIREGKASVWNFELGSSLSGKVYTGMAIMMISGYFLFTLSMLTGVYWQLFGGAAETLRPILRSVMTALLFAGSFLGAFALSKGLGKQLAGLYWVLVGCCFVVDCSSILLSSATALVLSILAGWMLGSGRVPVWFTVIAFGVLAFLNQSKFVMREAYWDEKDKVNVSLMQLPSFYANWASESVRIMSGDAVKEIGQATDESGQSLLKRINNLQNLQYVVQAQESLKVPPISESTFGTTYGMIPALLVPRIFWENKPRTHEGQVLLNLYYGRQQSVEQTEQTYIAWGLLPEAVGNYGQLLGATVLGVVLGFLLGLLEKWSHHKRLFSVAGLAIISLLLQLGLSFEHVSTVFITSTFQMLVSIVMGGLVLRRLTRKDGEVRVKW